MTKLDITKKIVANVAVYGSGVIVYAIIRNNLPPNLPIHKKVSAAVGAYVIGGIVGDAVEGQTDAIIDTIVEFYDNIKNKIR